MDECLNRNPALQQLVNDLRNVCSDDAKIVEYLNQTFVEKYKEAVSSFERDVDDAWETASTGSGGKAVAAAAASAASTDGNRNAKYILTVDQSSPLSQYDDTFWPRAFPHLFPYGTEGTPYQKRKTPLSLREWGAVLLQREELEYGSVQTANDPSLEEDESSFDAYSAPAPCFRRSFTFLCVVHNLVSRLDSLRSARVHVKRASFTRVWKRERRERKREGEGTYLLMRGLGKLHDAHLRRRVWKERFPQRRHRLWRGGGVWCFFMWDCLLFSIK